MMHTMTKLDGMRVAKGIIFVFPVAVFLSLLLQYMAWSGDLALEYDFSKEPTFVSEWYPSDRVTDRLTNERNHRSFQEIHGEPVYVDVEVPRAFEWVDMTVTYRNPEHPIVNAGIVANKNPWTVEYHPLQNTIIDEALIEWDEPVTEGLTTLLQASDAEQFESVDTFLEQVPDSATVGTYFYNRRYERIQSDYKKQSGELEVPYTLLGTHEFATYIKDEPLHAEFGFVDMNQTAGTDPIKVEVFDGDVLIHEELLDDDGVTGVGESSAERKLLVHLEGLPEGVYRYNVVVSDDIAITALTTQQHKFVAGGAVHTIDSKRYQGAVSGVAPKATRLLTNSPFVDLVAPEPGSLQTVRVNGERVELRSAGKRVHQVTNTSGLSVVRIPESDVQVLTQGFFAFTEESFFDPDGPLRPMTIEDELADFDYLLYHDYTPPRADGNRLTQTVPLTLAGLPIDRKNVTFALEAPYIDDAQHVLGVENVLFQFQRQQFVDRLMQRIKGEL